MKVAKKAPRKGKGRGSRRTATAAAARVATPKRTSARKGFSTTFTVDASPRGVFDAINDVRGWWTGEIDGVTDRLGAEFTYRHGESHRSTQRIVELVPGKRVVWHVSDASLAFPNQGEWIGTDIVFEIGRKGGETEVRFTHAGLVPRFQCYGDCSGAWSYFVTKSLRDLITTGKGDPASKEG